MTSFRNKSYFALIIKQNKRPERENQKSWLIVLSAFVYTYTNFVNRDSTIT